MTFLLSVQPALFFTTFLFCHTHQPLPRREARGSRQLRATQLSLQVTHPTICPALLSKRPIRLILSSDRGPF